MPAACIFGSKRLILSVFATSVFLTEFFNTKIFLKMNGLDKTNVIKFSLFLTVVCGFCADCRYGQQQKKKKEFYLKTIFVKTKLIL
jgi:hypothetical protein